MIRVSYVWGNLGPYHWARMLALARRAALRVSVVELYARERIREWRVHKPDSSVERHDTVFQDDDRAGVLPLRRVLQTVRKQRPDVVVWGTSIYGALEFLCARILRRAGVPSLAHFVSTGADARNTSASRLVTKVFLLRTYAGFLPVGMRQLDHLLTLGVHPTRSWIVGNPVDNAFFAGGERTSLAATFSRLTSDLEPGRFFLYVGRLSPEKNLLRLIDAFHAYCNAQGSASWKMALVGGGPQREDLVRAAAGSCGSIVLFPFIEGEELRAIYRSAGAFVLPSLSEPWGLVANEAAAAGLPLLLSNRCGCLPHLLREGENGFSFDPLDPDALTRSLRSVSSDCLDRSAASSLSARLVESQSLERYAAEVERACIAVTRVAR